MADRPIPVRRELVTSGPGGASTTMHASRTDQARAEVDGPTPAAAAAIRRVEATTLKRTAALLLLVPMLGSWLIWAVVPAGSNLLGFRTKSSVTLPALGLLAAWWGLALVGLLVGVTAGSTAGAFRRLRPVALVDLQRVAMIIGTVGTASTYWTATNGDLSRVRVLIGQSQLNRLRENVDYAAGVTSLRYAAIVAGGIAIYHLSSRAKASLVDICSLVTLVLTAMMSSRLALAMSVFVAVALRTTDHRVKRSRPSRRIITASALILCVFATFCWLNYTRNANYYRERGVSSPVVMGLWNAASYAAAPAQASFGYASALSDGRLAVSGGASSAATAVLAPTYLAPTPSIRRTFRQEVDLSNSLTTNSAFVQLLGSYGWWSIPFAALGLALIGYLFARFALSGGPYVAFAGIAGYAVAEFWRIYLVNSGVIHFALFCALVGLVPSLRRSRQATS